MTAEMLFHQRVAHQARRFPQRPAVVGEHETLTYGELEAAAERLARRLRALGIGPESRVAICAARSPRLVVALLAVLKAGGAYVPLDPAYPPERLAGMLEDSAAAVLVADPALAGRLPPHALPVLLLDAGHPTGADTAAAATTATDAGAAADATGADAADDATGAGADAADARPAGDGPARPPAAPAPGGANLMYVLFTSGSTGRPKPVAVEHRQALHYLDAIVLRLGLAAGGGDAAPLAFATVSTFAADLGNTMVLPALATGGCLHVVGEERLADAAALGDYMRRHAVDCLKIVPSHLAALLAVDDRVLPARRLVIGGEAASPDLLTRLRAAAAGGLQVFNHYGPTETTIGVVTRRLEAELPGGPAPPGAPAPAAAAAALPLGRPLPGVSIHLLDPQGAAVADGEAGEIHVGGATVTRGYLGRPDATAERFVPDPWSALPGGRLYRTGDRGRRDAAGDLEFLGRVDRQLKIRGFRIEPAEIETLLRQHPAIADAVVTAVATAAGEPLLAAHLVAAPAPASPAGPAPDDSAAPSPAAATPAPDDPAAATSDLAAATLAELRQLLADRLPEAMRPSLLRFLPALPLTPNGKVDRQALAAIPVDAGAAALPTARTPIEELVCTVWGQVLERAAVAPDDDFFALGGHSLRAAQAVARLRQAVGLDLPVNLVLEHPTAARCAAEIERRQRAGTRPLPAVAAVARDGGPLPTSYAQERLWLHDQLAPGSTAFNLGFARRWRGRLALPALDAALAMLRRRHEVLRTRIVAEHGVPRQWIDPAPDAAGRHWPLADLSALPGPPSRRERCAAAAVSDLQAVPFDLARGPLLRGALLRLAPDDHVLCLTVHHIAADGWALGVLSRELMTLYGWCAALPAPPSPAPPLPALPLQYADVADWQRRWLAGDRLDEQLSYWRRQLGGDRPRATLPTDRPPERAGGVLEQLRREIPPAVVAALLELGRKQGVTLFMVLVSAVKLLLYRYTGCARTVVGSMHANRTLTASEDLIGFFVNVLPIATTLAPAWTFGELLGEVRATTLGAYAHHDTPYEKILDSVQPGRSGARDSLFQVMAVLQNMPVPELRLPDVELAPFEPARATRQAAVDLTVTFTVEAGGLVAWAGYDAGLFEPATVERFCDHLEQVLTDVGRDPLQRLDAGGPLQLTARQAAAAPPDEVTASAALERSIARAATVRDQVENRRSQLSDKQLELLRRRLRG
jgi:amino acid adenylation domain-containing protein